MDLTPLIEETEEEHEDPEDRIINPGIPGDLVF
jgi:hypothetical protein